MFYELFVMFLIIIVVVLHCLQFYMLWKNTTLIILKTLLGFE